MSAQPMRRRGAPIQHCGNRAFYRRSTGGIRLPLREAFIGTAGSAAAEAYHSTLLHELAHFTGHETRCNRRFGQRVGDGLRDEAACRRAWRSVPVRRSWNFSRAARCRVASGGIET
jgi:antirestriction protein ArdC